MWADGQSTLEDDGTGGKQLFGVHPFALVESGTKGEFFGIYFRNTNAMSPVISYTGDSTSTLSYITTGGQIEMYVMMRGTPKQIIKQYQNIVGLPLLPPMWALGWHIGSISAHDEDQILQHINSYATDIPFESIWIEGWYMTDWSDFTVNTTAFPTIKELSNQLAAKDVKINLVLEAGLSSDNKEGKYYKMALDNNALIKSVVNPTKEGGILTQHMYSKKEVFLDLFSDKAYDVWKEGLKDLYTQIPFDGLNYELNEPTGLCNGECPDGIPKLDKYGGSSFLESDVEEVKNNTWYQSWTSQDEMSTYKMPFIPGQGANLDNMTLSLNGTHPSRNLSQYDVHNLNGHMQGKLTQEILANQTLNPVDKRPFILSRSTFAGSGSYMQHWIGGDQGSWKDLRYTVAQIMNFNMFGIPLSGTNVCGFKNFGDEGTNEAEASELCARQVQLSTFMPIARQRIMDQDDPKTGLSWKDIPSLVEPWRQIAVNAIFERLRYQRLLYTCLFTASQTGESCVDPLFFHYPTDEQAYVDVEHSFIYANALKVTPILEKGAKTVKSYFPIGDWVNMNNFADIIMVKDGGKWIDLPVPEQINMAHMMPGSIVPHMPNPENKTTTTDMTRNGHLHMVINRDANKYAQGMIFLDSGISLKEITDKQYEYYEIQHAAKSIKKFNKNFQPNFPTAGIYLHEIIIVNAHDLADTDFACAKDNEDGSIRQLAVAYDSTNFTLTLSATGGQSISLASLQVVNYGKKDTDLNICDISTQYYKFQNGVPDLSKNTAQGVLESLTPKAHQDIFLQMAMKDNMVNIKWNFVDQDMADNQFKVPADFAKEPTWDSSAKLSDVILIVEDAFGGFKLSIKNKNGGVTIYDLTGMILDSQFNYIASTAHVDGTDTGFKGILGLTDSVSDDLFLKDGVYTLWNKNANSPKRDGLLPGKNMYASSPFYMAKATDKSWFGVYHNSVAASDWWVENDAANNKVFLQTYATGGVGDIYIFNGATPESITQAYQEIIGTPVLTPQWALGWHQCQYGYKSTKDLQNNVQKYSDFNMPLDAQWVDIDLMKDYKDFTVDDSKFTGITQFIQDIYKKGIKFVPIVDAGIAMRPNEHYAAYDSLISTESYIRTSIGKPLIGNVWPVDVVFPDFFAKDAGQYWKAMLQGFQKIVGFSGIWLEMNEIENFCDGVCNEDQKPSNPIQQHLPYTPGGRDLEENTISVDGVHQNGAMELDVHNLFATSQVKATNDYFRSIDPSNPKRGLTISRSGSQGIGKFGGRVLGNNFSNQTYMGASVTSIMSSNIAGTPMAGADICGFFGDTTPELCARWYTIGAFYPFSRNHNNLGSIEQEPWSFQDKFISTIRDAMITKLSLVRYYHSELLRLNANGGTFYKPLFFEFPDDSGAYANQEKNVMLGTSLKLGIQSNDITATTSEFYYPQGTWCDIFNKHPCKQYTASENTTLPTGLGDFYLGLKAGRAIPFQNATDLFAQNLVNNTEDLKDHPVDFLILPQCTGNTCVANGEYANDMDSSWDLDKVMNNNTIYYSHDGFEPAVVNVLFNGIKNATNFNYNIINDNDELGIVEIYNAKSMGLDKNYTVSAAFLNHTVQALPFDAYYDLFTDRLVTQKHSERIWIPELDYLILNKKV